MIAKALTRAIPRHFPVLGAAFFGAILSSHAAPPASWQGPGIGAPAANPGSLDFLPGQLAGTCYSRISNSTNASDPEGFVIAFFDTRDPITEGAVPGSVWPTDSGNPVAGPFYRYHGDQLRAKVTGEVFGVCVSRVANPDIWISGTSAYRDDASSWDNSLPPNDTLPATAEQRGRVYRIDGTTGNPVDVVALNTAAIASGNGRPAELGNLCWDQSGDGTEWVYVSNFNDGLIYRLEAQNLQGSQLTFDHGVDARPNEGLPVSADDPASEFTSRDRLVWGLQIRPSDGRLYYSVWNGNIDPSEIWSVDLDPTDGSFLPATAQLEITVPIYTSYRYPIASLAFGGNDELMFAAERGHRGLAYGGAHAHRILEWSYDSSGPAWILDPQITPTPTAKYHMGAFSLGQNAAGGVQPDCDGNVWVTGDFYSGTSVPGYIYGTQRIPSGGNFATLPEQQGTTSLWIDYNDDTSKVEKYALGALAMWEPCACINFEVAEIVCPEEPDQEFQVSVNVTNLIDRTATIGWIRPCPEADLPEGAVTTTPNPRSLFNLNNPIALGESTTVDFGIDPSLGGQNVCFTLTLFDERMEECCTEKFCIDLPRCDCAIVLDQQVVSEQLSNGDVKHTVTITVRNSTHLSDNPYPFHFATVPPQPGFVTYDAVPDPDPILPGDVGTVTFCYLCPLIQQPCPDQIKTVMAFHDGTLENCCSIDVCIDLEPVGKVVVKDECRITPRLATLCFDPDRDEWFADIRVTICNNFCEPRTYEYNTEILPDSPDSMTTTGTGSVGPIPPGECRTISFRVSGQFAPGEQGNYEITFEPDDGGPATSCTGSVINPQEPVKIIDDNPQGLVINPRKNEITKISYVIQNNGQEKVELPLQVSSQFGALLVDIDGKEPSELVDETVLVLEPNSSVNLTLLVRMADPDRKDLPDFVEVHLVRLDGAAVAAFETPIRLSTPASAGILQAIQCLDCEATYTTKDGVPNGFRLTIEVLVPTATVTAEQTATLNGWQPAMIKTAPDDPEVSELTLQQGRHQLFISHPGSPHCFFRFSVK